MATKDIPMDYNYDSNEYEDHTVIECPICGSAYSRLRYEQVRDTCICPFCENPVTVNQLRYSCGEMALSL